MKDLNSFVRSFNRVYQTNLSLYGYNNQGSKCPAFNIEPKHFNRALKLFEQLSPAAAYAGKTRVIYFPNLPWSDKFLGN